jgi:polygalacturonase
MAADGSRRDFVRLAAIGIAGAGTVCNSAPAKAEAARIASGPSCYNIRHYGATGDGQSLDTSAINRAIEEAALAGGGVVYLPPGTYRCYSIRLKSNIALHLDPGATIVAADSPGIDDDGTRGYYDLAEPKTPWDAYQDYGHNHWHNSLIWGEGLENISIIGPGLIWGKGLSQGNGPGPKAELPGVGNKSIGLKNCHNVILRDFSILHGGHFGILATGVDNLTIDNLKIDTNRDGMDIDCCHNVRIANCSVNSPWDDAICLKSSFALGYARATQNVTITNCMVSGSFEEGALLDATCKRIPAGAKVKRLGRIKFGTESNGGFNNITVANCIFDGCNGLAIETVDGAVVEDVTISNIAMRDITNSPIFLRLGSRMRGPANTPVGKLRRVTITNVVCSNASSRISSVISGVPGHFIEDVLLANIFVQHAGGGTSAEARSYPLELAAGYPEPDKFGVMPSHGFFLRHIHGIEMRDINVRTAQQDQRPAFVLEDVEQADCIHLQMPRVPGVPALLLSNVRDFNLYQSRPLTDVHLDHAEKMKLQF